MPKAGVVLLGDTAGKDCAIWGYYKLCSAGRGCLLEWLLCKDSGMMGGIVDTGTCLGIGGARMYRSRGTAEVGWLQHWAGAIGVLDAEGRVLLIIAVRV